MTSHSIYMISDSYCFMNRGLAHISRYEDEAEEKGIAVVSILLNIPLGIYTIWFFLTNGLVSTGANILSIIVGILAQASMMVYGFAYLVPQSKKEGYHQSVNK